MTSSPSMEFSRQSAVLVLALPIIMLYYVQEFFFHVVAAGEIPTGTAIDVHGLLEVSVWISYIGKPIGKRAVPQFATGRGGK